MKKNNGIFYWKFVILCCMLPVIKYLKSKLFLNFIWTLIFFIAKYGDSAPFVATFVATIFFLLDTTVLDLTQIFIETYIIQLTTNFQWSFWIWSRFIIQEDADLKKKKISSQCLPTTLRRYFVWTYKDFAKRLLNSN